MAITFKVGFQLDDKQLQQGLQGIQRDLQNAFNVRSGNLTPELTKATEQAKILEMALKRATTDKGISFYSLTSELNKAGTSAAKLTATLASGGQAFATSLNAANTAFAVADRSVISLNGKIKEMSRVLTQSFKFTAAQTFLQGVSNAAQEAYRWVYDLNKTITDISVVTGYQGDQLDKITRNAIEGARELRIAANEYAEGALIFYQQGLGDDEVAQRVEITAKAARASGQSLDQMSSQLTAIWNTYKMTGDEMQRAASVGAKMAGDTAVDFADIAEAMQTAAAPAEQMGVSYNSLAAIIATVGDTTQQSASVIGNAFKTIFSRFQQLKSEGTDGEVTLNRVSSQLQELGVNVLDASGELRSLDSVIAEVGGQWDSWSSKQQLAIAQLVGGTRQYGQFLTLMNNFDKYQDLLGSANIEDGSTLEQQYESSLNSIESHAENAAESMRRAFGQIFDEDTLIAAYSTIEGIGGILETIIKTLGGGLGIINAIAAALSAKVGPALANNAQKATLLVNNLTYSGRKSNIDKEYDDKDAELQNRLDQGAVGAEKESLLIAKQKNDFSRKTAEINEQINTLLRNATGEERIRLQIKQQNLKTAQEEYQASLDQLHNLDGEIKKEQQLLDLQQKRKVAEAAVQVNEAKQAQRENINRQYNARQKLNGLDQSVAAQMANKEQAGDNWTQDQEDRLTETLRKQAQMQDELNDAMAEGLVIEERLQIAREELVNVTNNSAHATNQSILTINQAFSAWKSGAVESSDQVKSAIKANAETIISEYESIRNGFAQAGMDQEAQEATQRINELRQAIQNIDNVDDQALDGILADLNQMGSQLPQVTSRVNDLIQQNSDTILRSGQMRERQANAGSELNDPNANRSRIGRMIDAGTQRLGSGMGKVSNFLKSNEQVISGIAQIGTSATMVISTVQNMWGVISDPDASVLDKVTSVGTGIAAMVPNIMNVVQGFSKLPPQVAIATVAIGATIAAVALLWNEFQKYTPEAKFKRMSEAAEKLKTDAEEAKAQAEGLKSTIDSYDQAVSNLNNCVKGTEEWKEALKQTNDAARDVISSLSDLENVDLSNLYERDEDGMLKLNQEELDRISAEQDSLATQKEYAAQMAQIQASQLGNQVKAKDIASEYTMGAAGSIAAGAATGALYGTALGGPIGTAIGGLIGGLGGAILNDVNDAAIGEKISENLDELTQLDIDELRDKLTSFGLNVSGLSDVEIEGLRGRLQNLADSATAAQEKLEMVAGLAVDEKLGDKYSGEAKDVVTKQVAAEQQKLTEEWTSFMDDNFSKISDGSTEDRNKLVEAFNAAMGTNYTADGNFSRGTDGNRTFAFKNAVTGEIETFTKEYIASTIAAQQALEGLEVSAKEAENMLKNLSVVDAEGNKDDGATQAIRDFISTGNLEGATQGEFETIQQGVKDAGSAQAYLESIGFTPEVAEQYAADFEAALDIDWTSVTAKLPESFKEAEDLSLSQARGFGDTYQKIIGIAGEEAGKQYEGMMNGILDQISSEEDKTKAMDILSGIDWTQWDAADQAAKAMREMGYEIDTSAESWITFTNNMRETFKAIPDLDSLITQMQQVKGIAEGVELGSIISKEDYETLVNYNSELGKYFMILADGSAQMMGDPLDFMQEVERSGQQALKDTIAQYKQMEQELEGVSGSQNYKGSNDKNYYRGNNVQTQLDYIQASGTVDQSQIDAWREDLADGQSTVETIDAIGEAFDALGQSSEIAAAKASQAMTELAMTASSAEERMQMLESGDIDEVAYAQASMAAINEEKWEGFSQEDIEGIQDYADHLQDVADNSELVSDELKDNEEAAEDVAREVTKMNRGIETLAEGFEDWSDILKNSDKSSQEYSEAMDNMKEAMSDVLGVSEEFLSDDFILDNMEDIKLAAEGDAEAIDRLAIAAARDIIVHMDIQDEALKQKVLGLHDELAAMTPDIEVGATLNSGDFYAKAQELVDTAGMSVEQAQAYFNSLGYEPVFEMRNETRTAPMYGKRVYSDDPVMGYAEGPNGEQYPYIKELTTHEEEVYMGEQEQNFVVPALTPEGTPKIKEIRRTSSGAMNNFSSSNKGGGSPSGGSKSGGGGSAPKHQAKKAEKRDSMKIADRYSTTQAKIDDVQRSLDKLDKSSSDMWGGGKLKALQKYNDELWTQAENYKELLSLAENYKKVDQSEADKAKKEASKELGANLIDIKYNDDGYVANRTEIINQLDDLLQAKYDEYYNAAQRYDAAQSTNEAESERIDKLKEEYEDLQKYVDDYVASLDQADESAAKAQEALEQLVEMIRTEIANRVEILTYKIELQVEMNDRELNQLERTLEHLGDLGVTTGKSFDLLSQSFEKTKENAWLAADGFNDLYTLLQSLDTEAGQAEFIKKFGQKAWDEYTATGKIPEEIMSEMLSQYDDLVSRVDDLYDNMDKMFDQYLDLLDQYIDKFDQITEKLDANNDRLELYEKLLEFSGQGQGSQAGMDARKGIAEARVSNAVTALHNSQAAYDTFEKQYAEWEQSVKDFQEREGYDPSQYDETASAAWNRIQEQGQSIKEAMDQYAQEIIDNAANVVEVVQELIDTGTQIIIERTIDNLNGMFDSVDNMMEQFNQKKELRDLWLMDYDKTYQLESLLREIDDAMANVTDPGRLQEYGDLIDQINEKNQEGVKVSQNQVDILKAQFEIQKAKDAYEEAQNAKNTMRLARDASGNWNYVYSQDQSQTDDAAQKLADAQYQYEKLLHTIEDESSERWLSIRQEMIQFRSEVNWALYETDEAYKAQVDATWNYYVELTEYYADEIGMCNDLLGQNFKDTTLGIITGFDTMEQAQDAYSKEYEQMTEDLKQNTKDAEQIVREECDKMGISYDDLAKQVKDDTGKMIAENTRLETDIKDLAKQADSAMTSMMKSVSSATASMIQDIRALEAEIRAAIALLEQLTQKEMMGAYDRNTDYADYLHTDYKSYTDAGGTLDMATWLDRYHKADVYERMGAGNDRYEEGFAGENYQDAIDKIVSSYNPNATYINGDQFNFGDGESSKVLTDWTGIAEKEKEELKNQIKGQRAEGGIVNEHGLYELAENGTEFVLNPEDTRNILSAVKYMREAVQSRIISLNGAIGKKTESVTEKSTSVQDIQQIDQQVHIDATFPNVSVASEIEEAFSNLVNQAVQYASSQRQKK